MERWEYIEVFFLKNEQYIYFFPDDKIDITTLKQTFKSRGADQIEIEKEGKAIYIRIDTYKRTRSNLILALNVLGQNGWEAFSASNSEGHQSVFLKRRIEE